MMGSSSEGGSFNEDYDWNTDDEIELFGAMPSSGSTELSTQEISSEHSFAESGGTSSMSAKHSKLIFTFVGMGFSREMVIKAIEGNGEDNEEDILERLLTLGCLENPTENASNKPSGSGYGKKRNIPFDLSDSDKDSCPGSPQNIYMFEKDEILSILVNMGYTCEEASMAFHKCGPEAQICELADFISATQLGKEIDSFSPPNKKLKTCMENDNVEPYNTMIGRKLPNEIGAGPPYFYFENVANAPKGVWNKISSFLFEIQPEFVDSKLFCAAARKRGYIHNLPIHNRSYILPKQPLTIQEALPRTKRWWPSWDKRTTLNCLITSIAAGTVTERIRKELEMYGDDEPPLSVQQNVLKECRRWNLVWVGKNRAAPLEPGEYESLLGFPEDHTRGGGASHGHRYKGLGNAFQVDTVGYHLSVLKGRFPNGINVLSLFSGIGGAEVALHRLGILLKNVVSVELVEANRNIIRSWWEQTEQSGNLIEVEDVQQVSLNQLSQWMTQFGGFDLIIGGSPCNNISGSNRVSRNGLEGEQSSLFYHYFRIVETVMDIHRSEFR